MIRGLKYIRDVVNNYWVNHNMINTIKFGDTDNLSIYKDLHYPLLNYNYLDSNYKAGMQNTARFEFYVMDLTDADDIEMDFEIVANMNEIANDFLKWLENHDDIEIQPNVSIVPFSDSFGDRVSGVAFTVTFNVFRNNCSFL
ncbi:MULTISPECIES: hypothetical protein [Sphingobacterium]|uniref:hypothetical protein n=1 Tax=Sphingobacterium TaxID=28453 RepID=UPI0013DBBCE8|nr:MULTISPECIES: hypothetical protein [unclassified Sphingobacterium]